VEVSRFETAPEKEASSPTTYILKEGGTNNCSSRRINSTSTAATPILQAYFDFCRFLVSNLLSLLLFNCAIPSDQISRDSSLYTVLLYIYYLCHRLIRNVPRRLKQFSPSPHTCATTNAYFATTTIIANVS